MAGLVAAGAVGTACGGIVGGAVGGVTGVVSVSKEGGQVRRREKICSHTVDLLFYTKDILFTKYTKYTKYTQRIYYSMKGIPLDLQQTYG